VARRAVGISRVEDLTGKQKVAVLLMALGEEVSGMITQYLPAEDVEAISFEIARMGTVPAAVVESILDEWQNIEKAAFSLAEGGVDYARRLLEKAFGPSKAGQILKRIETQLSDHISLAHLRNADPQQLTAVLRNEHPQTIALILAYLDPSQTAAILKEIDPFLGSDVLLRMARMEKVMPDVLRLIEESLGADSDLSLSGNTTVAGGPESVAEVLNILPSQMEKDLLDGVADQDMDLADEIKNLMFVFEDIIKLDEKGIARLLRDVESKDLAMALKAASEELAEKLLGTMSSRARDSLEEEMEFLGPVRVSDVEAAQAAIVQTARTLEEAGEIIIGGGGDDAMLI
jgi:flagellar motor switch protein FliG